MAATLDNFFGKKDDLRVPYGRGEKPDSEKSVDVRSEERLMSKSPLPGENKLKAAKLCTGDGMKDLKNPGDGDPETKSKISGLFANSKENMDKDRASVKVYTRRVGQDVFWDTKLQRDRTWEELARDPEIRDELRGYKMFLVLRESEMESEMDLRMMAHSGNLRINADNCWDTMELEHPATFEELGMDPENKGIISDFFGFVRANELCKRIDQASKKDNCLVYDSPGTGRSSIIAAMANYLKFDIYHLDLTNFSSLRELQYTLLSTRNRSIIAIEGLYQCAGMLLNLKSDEYAAKYLMMGIDALFSKRDNEWIFVFTTNHKDQHDVASLRPVGTDIYINTSSPLPTSLPDGGKRTYHNSLLVSNSEKENMREACDSTKGYLLPNFDAPENKAVKVYSRRGRDWSNSMEIERPPTFSELGKDPENEGILSDLLRFVRDKELYKRIGKNWRRGYLLYDSPGTDRSSLIAAMASYLKFDIYDLDLTGLSSIQELKCVLTYINKRSLIAIKDIDHWFGMHPNLKKEVKSLRRENKLTLSDLFEIIDQLWYRIRDQQIIVLTTNHNQRDPYHTALLSPLNIDAGMHTSSPQPIALPDGGEIVQLDSSEHKPLVDFDATKNRAYQSSVLVSNSEKENMRETSKRQCMTESVLSSDDSRTRISLKDFVALNYRANRVRKYQNGSIMFTSDNKDTREGLNGECLTKSVLSDDDLTKQELLPEKTSLAFSELTSEDIDGFYDSISFDSDSGSDFDDFDDGPGMLPDLKDEFVDGLSSSCGDERITVSTTNHRDPPDAALLPLVNMETDIHTASPQLIALPNGGEIVQLESIEQKPLVDFDATNNRAYQSGVLVSSKKKKVVEAYKGQWKCLIQRTKKDMGEGSNKECLAKGAVSLDDSTERNSIDPRQGRGRLHSMEHEQPATFAELGTDPENESIVYDLLRFVREKEFYKRVGKAWKRGYLLYDPPCTDRSSLMAYTANRLEYDIHDLDLTCLSSIEELTNVLVSIRNRSLIAIKDFDHWVGMLPNLKNEKLTLSVLLEIIHGLLSSYGDKRIIILTTNHNHIDRVDAALLRPLIIDLCLHTSSPQPMAVADGAEIVQLDSSEQKPLEDFDATSNRAYQSDILVCNSEGKSTREASRRKCMPESVLSLVDSMTRISSTDFYAPNCSAHLERADQSGPIVFNLETKDSREGLNRECLTKSVLSLDDSSRQKSLPDVDATKNKAHLVRAYQKGLVVSLSENKNRGEALKRECITRNVLGLGDLQQHFGGRRDDAAKNFGAIYDLGINTTDSLARKAFKVEETLPIREQPNDCVPLLSIGKLTLKGWVQEEKSQNLPRVLQLNIVEQRVTKLPICLEGLTVESASNSWWPIGLPDGRHIVVLHPLEQSTNHVAHAARVDQCFPTVSLPEKEMVRKTLKRKCRTMSVMEIRQQHFGRRSEGSAKNFRAMHTSRKHVTNWVSTEKRIHGIHQWPFRQCGKAGESGPTVSNSEKGSMREALKRDSLRDLRQHFGARRKGAVKGLWDSLALKSFEVLDSLSLGKHSNNIRHLAWWRTLTHKHCVRLKKSQDLPRSLLSDYSGKLAAQFAIGLPDGGRIPSLSKKIVKNTLKRKSRTISVLSLEDHRQHVGRRRRDDANFLGAKHICRQLAVDGESTTKCIRRQHGTSRWPFKQSVIGLPDGGYMLSLSKKKIVRKTFKRKCRNMSVLSLEYHWKVDSKWEDSMKSIGAKRIYRQLVIHFVSRVKRIHRQHGFHRWPFQQNWPTRKGQSLGDERPSEFMRLSTDGKLISRLQRIHVSWLGRFSPWPSALQGAAEIVGPTALSSSEFAATNRAHRVGQDQSSPTASPSKKKRTREQEDREEINTSITLNDLRQHYGRKRKDAAESLGVSVSSLKRICRQHGIKRWPNIIRKKVWRPPDPHGETNPSPTCETLSTNGQIEMENDPAPSQGMPTIPQTMGSSNDWRNLLASQEEPFLEGHVLGSFNWGDASCYDLVLSQPMTTIPHTMGSLDDSRNLLASQEEPFLEKDLFGFVDGAVASCYDPALSQPMPTILHTMGSSIDWRNLVTSQQEPFLQGDVSGSINWIVPTGSYPTLSQPMSTIARTMPEIPLTENEDTGSVELKATYGDTIIKFQLRPMFGISELKEEVSKRREFELGSYKIEYKDAEGDWTLIACNDDIRRYLQQLNSFGKHVIELRVRDECPNTTNSCEFCGSLIRESP